MNDILKIAAVALGVYVLIQVFEQPGYGGPPYYAPYWYGWPYWQRNFISFPFGFNFGRPVPPDIDEGGEEMMGHFGGGHMGGGGGGNMVPAMSAGAGGGAMGGGGGAAGGGGGHH